MLVKTQKENIDQHLRQSDKTIRKTPKLKKSTST